MAIMNEELDLMDTLYAKIAELEREAHKLRLELAESVPDQCWIMAYEKGRAEERERCENVISKEVVRLPAGIAEQEASAWWLGFNFGVHYMREAIRALGDES